MNPPQKDHGILLGIKSKYNLQEIFDFLIQNIKLNVIKYNKEIQNKLNITLDDYKKESQYDIVKQNGVLKKYIHNLNIKLIHLKKI